MKWMACFFVLIGVLIGCQSASAPETLSPTVNLSASVTEGRAPLTVTFTAVATDPNGNALTYWWEFGDGYAARERASQTHTYTAPGIYTARVDVFNGQRGTAHNTVEVRVLPSGPGQQPPGEQPPAEPPAITHFSAEPPTITAGQSATLSWSVAGTAPITLSITQGIGDVSGRTSATVSPTTTTTYTLTATNSAGSDSAQVTVTVETPPPGNAIGGVVNAVDAAPIGGATVNFGRGITTTTATDGTFSLSLPAGTYNVTVAAPGFINLSIRDVAIASDETTDLEVIALSPADLPSGETRIVLTWGATPEDLDAHLTGPVPDSDERFHVFWPRESRGSLTSPPYAYLDVDDIDSFGPETITIPRQFSGVYRYSVHDYTNRHATQSTALAQSGAVVRVFRGDREIAQFPVPNQGGTLWTVFEMDGTTGNITPVNAIGYHTNPGTIQ